MKKSFRICKHDASRLASSRESLLPLRSKSQSVSSLCVTLGCKYNVFGDEKLNIFEKCDGIKVILLGMSECSGIW